MFIVTTTYTRPSAGDPFPSEVPELSASAVMTKNQQLNAEGFVDKTITVVDDLHQTIVDRWLTEQHALDFRTQFASSIDQHRTTISAWNNTHPGYERLVAQHTE